MQLICKGFSIEKYCIIGTNNVVMFSSDLWNLISEIKMISDKLEIVISNYFILSVLHIWFPASTIYKNIYEMNWRYLIKLHFTHGYWKAVISTLHSTFIHWCIILPCSGHNKYGSSLNGWTTFHPGLTQCLRADIPLCTRTERYIHRLCKWSCHWTIIHSFYLSRVN